MKVWTTTLLSTVYRTVYSHSASSEGGREKSQLERLLLGTILQSQFLVHVHGHGSSTRAHLTAAATSTSTSTALLVCPPSASWLLLDLRRNFLLILSTLLPKLSPAALMSSPAASGLTCTCT